jgi:hypothetical protein
MEDRRRVERAPAERVSNTARMTKTAVFGVTNLETDRLVGQMTDISPAGIQLTAFRPVEVKSTFNFRLRLPEPILGSLFIIMDAECLWCKQGPDEKSYTAGFKLLSITPNNSKRIQALLANLGKTHEVTAV